MCSSSMVQDRCPQWQVGARATLRADDRVNAIIIPQISPFVIGDMEGNHRGAEGAET